jgi:PAS domain S-box-containing protein
MSMGDLRDSREELIEKLRASEARRRKVFEMVQAGILVQSADGEITYANKVAERILAFPAKEITEKTSEDPAWQMVLEDGTPVPAEDHPSMITLRTGTPMRNEVRGLFADDPEKTRWLLINTEPVFREESETPADVIITFNDISERINADEERRQLEQ